MAQHFLLSAKARTLSLGAIMRMDDDAAHARFVAIRFADNDGVARTSSASQAEPSSPAASCRSVTTSPPSPFS